MKGILKRCASLLLVLVMCISAVPLESAAEGLNRTGDFSAEQENGAGDGFSQSVSISEEIVYRNPLYEDESDGTDFGENSTQNSGQSPSVSSYSVQTAEVSEYCTSVEEAAARMRTLMKERETSMEIGLQTTRITESMSRDEGIQEFGNLATEIFWESVEHTGNPVEGDSLNWQYKEWNCSGSYSFQGDTAYVTFQYKFVYYTTRAQEDELDAAVDSLLQKLDLDGKSEYDKICRIYDYICDNVTYDYDTLNDDDYKLKYTAYAALINKTAVCQGYALLFYRLALESGVDARLIPGTSHGESHAWNIAKIGKKYYNLDSTWDAGKEEYSYFLKCSDHFDDHTRKSEYNTDEFNETYPMSDEDYTFQESDSEEIKVETPVLGKAENVQSGVKVTWSSASGADYYQVYRKISDSEEWTKVGDPVETTSYTDTDVESGKTYFYTVSGIAKSGEKAVESKYNDTGISIQYIAAPKLKAVANQKGSMKITWNKVSGAEKYRVYVYNSSIKDWSKVTETTSASAVFEGTSSVELTSGKTYKFTVRCITKDGKKAVGSYDSKGISYTYLSTPSVSVSNASSGVTVKWKKVTGAKGYYVYRKTGSGSYEKIAVIESGSTVSYTDKEVKSKNGTTYTYTVRAYNGSSKSTYTGKKIVRLTAPSSVSVSNNKTKAITVKWSKNSKVTGYQVYYKTGSAEKTVTVKGSASLSKVIQKLSRNKTYTVKVRCYKTVSKVNYYSAWSASKTVKIKK